MNFSGESLLRGVVAICVVALLWLAVFNVNTWLFSHAAFSERAHWIFLPAAFRIIAVLVLGLRGGAGLMLGAYLICPLLGGPKSMLFWTRKEKTNAIQETHAGGDYRQAA